MLASVVPENPVSVTLEDSCFPTHLLSMVMTLEVQVWVCGLVKQRVGSACDGEADLFAL